MICCMQACMHCMQHAACCSMLHAAVHDLCCMHCMLHAANHAAFAFAANAANAFTAFANMQMKNEMKVFGWARSCPTKNFPAKYLEFQTVNFPKIFHTMRGPLAYFLLPSEIPILIKQKSQKACGLRTVLMTWKCVNMMTHFLIFPPAWGQSSHSWKYKKVCHEDGPRSTWKCVNMVSHKTGSRTVLLSWHTFLYFHQREDSPLIGGNVRKCVMRTVLGRRGNVWTWCRIRLVAGLFGFHGENLPFGSGNIGGQRFGDGQHGILYAFSTVWH